MAESLKNFKDIINNKAYTVNAKDRKIFEEGDLQSFFGLSDSDTIEFILYDGNNNQLPQQNYGLVRYIPLTTENINDYFLIGDGTVLQRYALPNQYFIDVNRLINEAGYQTGLFKTQITLINNRVGSNSQYDKLWVSEISPSRTEMRLFPLLRAENENTDLNKRFSILMNDGHFREDTDYQSIKMIEKISPSVISEYIKISYGNDWYDKLKTEYKIDNFDSMMLNINNKFTEACYYYISNRVSDLNDIQYGKPKKTKTQIELTKETIINDFEKILINTLDFYLMSRVEETKTKSIGITDSSMDSVGKILQTKNSDLFVDTSSPILNVVDMKKPKETEQNLEFEKQIENEIPKEVLPEQPTITFLPPNTGNYGGGAGNYVREYIPNQNGFRNLVEMSFEEYSNRQEFL
jgi:hypothetical protein